MRTGPKREKWYRIAYRDEPDFSLPALEISEQRRALLLARLARLYTDRRARLILPELLRLLRVHHAHKPVELLEAEASLDRHNRFTERDLMLITYGDMIRSETGTGFAALYDFLAGFRGGGEPVFSILHVLPFFPSSSDRGFSVVDYKSVDPKLGGWEDLLKLGARYRLMFDGVMNHASAQSAAFREMLAGNPDYWDFALSFGSKEELTEDQRAALRRPRTSDVLTEFQSIDGPIWVWTTFSPDQIDLNYRNPRVLLGVLETLLYYVRRGADLIRLDAVTYLWKEMGTSSASLEETHEIVKLFRDVLDIVAPGVAVVTETNVPHEENISYFGNGSDEAQMVYNFALPPLVLHAFYREDASWLSHWAAGLAYPSTTTTYLNMLDTHDGIGLLGVNNVLPASEVDLLVEQAREHGAFISYRATAAGEVPYEINTTWYSALNFENNGESKALQVARAVASRSIAFALRGVPAVYLHSLAGSRNDVRLALRTKVKRDMNRATLEMGLLERNLKDPASKLHLLASALRRLLRTRVMHPAFHPNAPQRVLSLDRRVFALLRTTLDGAGRVLCLTNVSNQETLVELPVAEIGVDWTYFFDLIAGRGYSADQGWLRLRLQPYEYIWLTPSRELERSIDQPH
jgi:sucrose phosphorylase